MKKSITERIPDYNKIDRLTSERDFLEGKLELIDGKLRYIKTKTQSLKLKDDARPNAFEEKEEKLEDEKASFESKIDRINTMLNPVPMTTANGTYDDGADDEPDNALPENALDAEDDALGFNIPEGVEDEIYTPDEISDIPIVDEMVEPDSVDDPYGQSLFENAYDATRALVMDGISADFASNRLDTPITDDRFADPLLPSIN